MSKAGLYIHIPFCRQKCLYCDFYSAGSRIADWHRLTDCLLNELEAREAEIQDGSSTLYIGGGTPSLMPDSELTRIVGRLNDKFGVNSWNEFTLEVNPEDVNDEKCRFWKSCGVNRVSIGIQSLDDKSLKIIGRRHSANTAVKAIETLKKYFGNISVDVMFGLPGQDLSSYRETLSEILSLSPQHISSYSLMLEKGTALEVLGREKKISLPSENEWIEMFDVTFETLEENGYLRYEISNYSLPGFKSLHNSSYWKGNPYLGLGPGAHSYDGKRVRRANPADLKGYLHFFQSGAHRGEESFYKEERLTDIELREELIMTRMRLREGLDLKELEKRFGTESVKRLMKSADPYIASELLVNDNSFLSFSSKAIPISDSILADLI